MEIFRIEKACKQETDVLKSKRCENEMVLCYGRY